MTMRMNPATPVGGNTLYRRIVEQLLTRIDSGDIGIGDVLPPEPELAEQYSVSRHTMREAMRILRQMGVVDRRPGAGTTVKASRPQRSYAQLIRSPQELLQYPPSRLSVQDAQFLRADRALAKVLKCRTGERWFRVRAVRRLKGKRVPICWLDLYLLPKYAGVLPLIGKSDQPVYEMIREKYGEQTSAVCVDLAASCIAEHMATALDAKAGDSALRIVRRYQGADRRIFQVSVSQHPADRYYYRIE